jgi:hypothetical protein
MRLSKGTSVFPRPPCDGRRAERLRLLGETADALDDVLDALTPMQVSVQWTAREWSVASMPLRVRLPRIEDRLRRLAQVELTEWPDLGWALALDETRARAEEAISDISVALVVLQTSEGAPEARVRSVRRFLGGRDTAHDALGAMRELIVAWRLRPGRDG